MEINLILKLQLDLQYKWTIIKENNYSIMQNGELQF